MVMPPSLTGRENLLRALDHHPYARLTAGGADVRGYHRNGALVWTAHGPWGPLAASFGDAPTAARLFGELALADALGGAQWLHLPRVEPAQLTGTALTWQDDWDFLWTTAVTEPRPGESEVKRLAGSDHGEIAEVLADGLPTGTSTPTDPLIHQWYGIRSGGRLVAVAADRSTHGVGFITGVAVRHDERRKGHGGALTAGVTRRLLVEHHVCGLGVMADDADTIRLYQRLGYRHRIARSTARVNATG